MPTKRRRNSSKHIKQTEAEVESERASAKSRLLLRLLPRVAILAVIIYFYLLTLHNGFASLVASTQSVKAVSQDVTVSSLATLEGVKRARGILLMAMEQNFAYSLLLFSGAYLFKQTFAIPGSALLNVTAGAILPIYLALPLTTFLTALGASACYTVSKLLLPADLVQEVSDTILPGKLVAYRSSVVRAKAKGELFFYLLFLRLFPLSPNWFNNIVSPWIGIELPLFFTSVLLGLAPYNFITCQAGGIISELQSPSEILSTKVLIALASIALAALIPIYVKSRARSTVLEAEQESRAKPFGM